MSDLDFSDNRGGACDPIYEPFATPPAWSYVLGQDGFNVCPTGASRLTYRECHDAADRVGNYIMTTNHHDNPAACYKRSEFEGWYYFNFHYVGSESSGKLPVCKEEARASPEPEGEEGIGLLPIVLGSVGGLCGLAVLLMVFRGRWRASTKLRPYSPGPEPPPRAEIIAVIGSSAPARAATGEDKGVDNHSEDNQDMEYEVSAAGATPAAADKKCGSCGKPISDGWLFCDFCGHKLSG